MQNDHKQTELDSEDIDAEAKRQGKVSFHTWLTATWQGKDPEEYARQTARKYHEKRLAYSEYVRHNEKASSDQSRGPIMPASITLEDIKQLLETTLDARFAAEREHTRTMIKEGVDELRGEFTSFIEDNFTPAMDKIDQRFDRLEDHLDRLDIDVATLRTDMRHVKQALQTRAAPAS
jgi:hypothetical protein